MTKIFLFFMLFLFTTKSAFCAAFDYGYTKEGYKYVLHKHNEVSYQHVYCALQKGIEEYKNDDYTRVDCLTDTHAIEFDFADKWAESVGQALHYAYKTNKRGKVVLILENPEKQMWYFNRVKNLGDMHGFDVEYITEDILNTKNGKCSNLECRCQRKKKYYFINRIKYFINKLNGNLDILEN